MYLNAYALDKLWNFSDLNFNLAKEKFKRGKKGGGGGGNAHDNYPTIHLIFPYIGPLYMKALSSPGFPVGLSQINTETNIVFVYSLLPAEVLCKLSHAPLSLMCDKCSSNRPNQFSSPPLDKRYNSDHMPIHAMRLSSQMDNIYCWSILDHHGAIYCTGQSPTDALTGFGSSPRMEWRWPFDLY